MKTIIGIDFDNTIVCYHHVFHEVAYEQGLIPADFPQNKEKIRDYFRSQGQENLWTEMQGYVYGKRMELAEPFPGVKEFIAIARARQIPVYIVSHKTKRPYAGPPYDLHAAAQAWLAEHHYFGLTPSHAFFLESKQEKCQKIGALACTHFIDDLPELLSDPAFPAQVEKLLFAPDTLTVQVFKTFHTWPALQDYYFGSTPS